MAQLQPPPTYAEVILINEQTKQGAFNPIWLKWFLELAQSINSSGGVAGIAHNLTTGLQGGTANQYYHLTATQQGLVSILVSTLTDDGTNLSTLLNLGVGVVTPTGKLDIKGTPGIVALIFTPGDAGTNTVRFNDFNSNQTGFIDALTRMAMPGGFFGNSIPPTLPTTGLYSGNSITPTAMFDTYGTIVSAIRVRHARGTAGAPTAIQSGDTVGVVQFASYGTSFTNVANVNSVAAENHTGTAKGTYLTLGATPVGSTTLTEILRVDGLRLTCSKPLKLKGYTTATLPAGVQGDEAFVTDALGPAYLTPVVGGGAVVTKVFYDGTNWIT